MASQARATKERERCVCGVSAVGGGDVERSCSACRFSFLAHSHLVLSNILILRDTVQHRHVIIKAAFYAIQGGW